MRALVFNRTCLLATGLALLACGSETSESTSSAVRDPTVLEQPSILLITLDTTRADALGLETDKVETPALNALAERGQVFSQAYATAPMTLPAHTSIFTGLYPTEHGIHENGRRFSDTDRLLAKKLRPLGYKTAAFVSAFPLAAEFGLASGFDHYDDELPRDKSERPANETTDRALEFLEQTSATPLFLWVHYFDPHEPYEPPEPYRSEYPEDPYLGEIAFVDRELGRLIGVFEARFEATAYKILVAGDHGQGLGDHGEALHGNLLYQGVVRVPLIAAGSELPAGRVDVAVSTRRIFDTILGWAGNRGGSRGLLSAAPETVLGESFKPYLQYGWQPQVMAVDGSTKFILSGELEVFDLATDPAEATDLSDRIEVDPEVMKTLREHWERALSGAVESGAILDQEAKDRLASLGYIGSEGRTVLRDGAPNPKDMVELFHDLDIGSVLFIRGEYEEALPLYERVLAADPDNPAVCLHLAVAHSVLGEEDRALEYFARARQINPNSVDLQHYLAMHHFRFQQWDEAEPLFEIVLAATPDRLPALECLAQIRERQGRVQEASSLLERITTLKSDPQAELLKLGEMKMSVGDTLGAIRAFERARVIQEDDFDHHLELGVLLLADRQLTEAAASLDRVTASHPAYPLALFKRAQVSVLLGEPDQDQRIQLARDNADAVTAPLIANERLFQKPPSP
ncbi:MAG: sulfatase-like hydrolase/transferase [Thermoanaerobaculia bacterium]